MFDRSGAAKRVSTANAPAVWQLIFAALLLVGGGCVAPTVISSATQATPGASVRGLVLGRIQVHVAGQPVRVGREGAWSGARASDWAGARTGGEPPVGLAGEATLTMLLFHRVGSEKRFAFEVEDESGRFEVLLPRGRYGIHLRCGKWRAKTPAQFEVTEEGGEYYVGTLRAELFRRRSLFGWFVRFFGGTVPRGDTEFAVADEWDWAQANLRSFAEGSDRIEKRLMRLAHPL